MEKGKYVSRAVYAKLQAENKRMKKDIKILVGFEPEENDEEESIRNYWNAIFYSEVKFNRQLSQILNATK